MQFRSGLIETLMTYRADKLKSAEKGVKMAKRTLKMKVKVTHFQYMLKVKSDAYLGSGLVESLRTYCANELKVPKNIK